MPETPHDVAVIGGGIVGLAVADALLQRRPDLRLLLLEKESSFAAHQTGHNSGVIHSGIYYPPGSLKAQLCVEGGRQLIAFCQAQHITFRRCGKVIVATTPKEVPRLEALEARGRANGVPGLRRLSVEELRAVEPQVRGVAALHLPEVGIVDFRAVAEALAQRLRGRGAALMLGEAVTGLRRSEATWELATPRGAHRARWLITCGGLHADRLAQLAGDRHRVQLVPFRGEYCTVRPERSALVRGLVYPVPDPRFPFLGVHFTKLLDGGVHVGPNAVLAFKREGYRRSDVSWRDCGELLASTGFWRMAGRYWRTGMGEWLRANDPRAMLRAAQRLVPSLALDDLRPSEAGVRAQAVNPDGTLVDDFVLQDGEHALFVYNAPSPAATASLSIGAHVAERVLARLRQGGERELPRGVAAVEPCGPLQ